MANRTLKAKISLLIIIVMMTSMIFNSGITVRAAELDENIIFGETADDSSFPESNEYINDNQDQIPDGSSETFFFEEGSDSNSQTDQNTSDSNNNSASAPALDYESLDSLDPEISDNPESKEVTENLTEDSDLNNSDLENSDLEALDPEALTSETTTLPDKNKDTFNTFPEDIDIIESPEEFIEEVELEELQVEDLPDEKELFAEYVDREFGVDYYEPEESSTANSRKGAPAKNYLNANEKIFYEKALELIQGVAAGEISSTGINYTAEELGLTSLSRKEVPALFDYVKDGSSWKYVINEAKRDQAMQDIQDQLSIDGTKVLNALCSDHPALLYWFGRSYQIGVSSFSSNTNGNSVNWTSDTAGTVDGVVEVRQFRIYLSVAFSYAVFEEGSTTSYYPSQADTVKTSATSAAVSNAQAIAESYASLGDYEKLLAFKEKICSMVTYNHTAAINSVDSMGSDPWELIYVFDNDPNTNVVCEGYSKAFQYLCDISTFTNDTEAISVTGTMDGGPHEWNVVQFEGKNYLTDVTNCDSEYFEVGHTGLFMKGYKSGSVSNGYVITRDQIDISATSYIPEEDISYIYDQGTLNLYSGKLDLLTLNNTDYSPDSHSTPAEITSQPVDAVAAVGKKVSFEVTAVGAKSYEWQYSTNNGSTWKNNWASTVTGTNTSKLTLPVKESWLSYKFRCAITGEDNNVIYSNPVMMIAKPSITSQPANVTAKVGDTINFQLTATGVSSYEWQYSTNNGSTWKTNWASTVKGTSTNKLTVPVKSNWINYLYKCVITGYDGSTVETNTVRVNEKLVINKQPVDALASVGNTVDFTVDASGVASYSWYFSSNNGRSWKTPTSTYIQGVNSETLTVKIKPYWINYLYKCVITGNDGTTIESDIVRVNEKLVINKQPVDVLASVGDTVDFTVDASGVASYSWYFSSNNGRSWKTPTSTYIQGVSSETLTVKIKPSWINYLYKCVITGNDGTTIESDIVRVNEKLVINKQPVDVLASVGDTVDFTVDASGATSYKWYFSSNNGITWKTPTSAYIQGVNSNTLTVYIKPTWINYQYKCIITGNDGSTIETDIVKVIG